MLPPPPCPRCRSAQTLRTSEHETLRARLREPFACVACGLAFGLDARTGAPVQADLFSGLVAR